jgi:hypothetical protein
MKKDELFLQLTIDVHYELGRTSKQDLEKVLTKAAGHIVDNGLLTGETEADALSWDYSVSETDSEICSKTKSSGWITDCVPSLMRDVFIDVDCDGGAVIIGFWDDSSKQWRVTGTNCAIEIPVFAWKEMPVVGLTEAKKAPDWTEMIIKKRLDLCSQL